MQLYLARVLEHVYVTHVSGPPSGEEQVKIDEIQHDDNVVEEGGWVETGLSTPHRKIPHFST